jgi:hypothetical protein
LSLPALVWCAPRLHVVIRRHAGRKSIAQQGVGALARFDPARRAAACPHSSDPSAIGKRPPRRLPPSNPNPAHTTMRKTIQTRKPRARAGDAKAQARVAIASAAVAASAADDFAVTRKPAHTKRRKPFVL